MASLFLILAVIELVAAVVVAAVGSGLGARGEGVDLGWALALFTLPTAAAACVLAFVAKLTSERRGIATFALVLAVPLLLLGACLLVMVAVGIAEEL